MNELLKKTIIVSEIKVNQGNIKIVDGQGLTYTIWETKKDGDKTVAYKTYEGLGNIMGKSLEIGYDEKDIPESQGKYRNIKTMKLVAGENMGVGQGINLTTPLERPQSNFKPSSTLTNERPQQENTYNQEIDKKAFGMCKYGFLIEAFKFRMQNEGSSMVALTTDAIEKEAEQWAEMSIRILPKDTSYTEVAGNDEIKDEDLPF